ncbi:outer membrane protein assembly factor BamE [Aestuariivita boseongensis]|uniref:outer membrane protein assembly factor BamE n=1 Tax=Aestuariivita boseongensis TaxID=1470562 RepID=UPI000680E202|nr:outer membrane protein assembly factor BamE [Aestuariivita boseongensis]
MVSTAPTLRRMARFGLTLVLIGTLSACATTYRNHGYVPSEDELAEVIVGVDTRDTVAETVGTPSSSGLLSDGGYYYVRSRVRHQGLREPKVVERQLVAISFSSNGVVENIERYELEDGQPVRLTRRVTESSIRDQGLIRQLLGNLANFNPGQFLE